MSIGNFLKKYERYKRNESVENGTVEKIKIVLKVGDMLKFFSKNKTFYAGIEELIGTDKIKVSFKRDFADVKKFFSDSEISFTPMKFRYGIFPCAAEEFVIGELVVNVIINIESPLYIKQERLFYRQSCNIKISYCDSDSDFFQNYEEFENSSEQQKEGICIDISEGGLKMKTNEPSDKLAENPYFIIKFELDNEKIVAGVKVVRIIPDLINNSCEIVLSFEKISDLSRRKIFKFIVESQRNLLKALKYNGRN